MLSPGVSSNLLRLLESLLLVSRLLVGGPLGLLEGLLVEGRLLVGRLDRLLRCRLVVGLLPPGLLLLLLVGRGRPLLLNLLEVLEPALLLLLRSSSCWPGLGLLLPDGDNLPGRLRNGVGVSLKSLLGCLLPFPELIRGQVPLWVVHILAGLHILSGVDAFLHNPWHNGCPRGRRCPPWSRNGCPSRSRSPWLRVEVSKLSPLQGCPALCHRP